MDGEKKARVRRSKEEIIADLEAKLTAENERHDKAVKDLKAKIEKAKTPAKPRMTKKQKNQAIMTALLKQYGDAQKVAEALGVDIENILNPKE